MGTKLRREGGGYARPEFYAPLSYGHEDEDWPNQLLERDRATVFKSLTEARAALDDTLKQFKEEGYKLPKNYAIYLIETEDAPSNATKPSSEI